MVGHPFPKRLIREANNAEGAKRFARQLHGRFGLPAHMADERLTSREAWSSLVGRPAGDPTKVTYAAKLILETRFKMSESTQFMKHDAILDPVGGMAQVLQTAQRPRPGQPGSDRHPYRRRLAGTAHSAACFSCRSPPGCWTSVSTVTTFTQIGVNPQVRLSGSNLTWTAAISCWDDVLHTGAPSAQR